MIFAAAIVTFAPNNMEQVKKNIENLHNPEIHFEDKKQGKIVITIEGDDNNAIENVRLELLKNDCVSSAEYYAFHFGEEVEKTIQGDAIKDFDIESAFKKHKNRQ